MLEAFRALGGIAENIRLDEAEGELSPCDAGKPVLLRVPENLLFPLQAFEVTEGYLRLKDPESVSRGARDFFERYECIVGPPIFQHATAQIAALDSLPARVKEVLSANFGMRELFEGTNGRRTESRFVERRAFRRGAQQVIAPILELAKHDPRGLAIQHDGGIKVGGAARDSLRIFHPSHDALAIFARFGFAAEQPAAFSLPMTFATDGIQISIQRRLHLGERRGDAFVPQLDVVARDSLALSHLMIGQSRFPRLSRGIFYTRMRDADLKDPDVQFDRIAQQNTAKLLDLLHALEGEDSPAILSLRRTARHQLEAMSWSIGTREI